jgi:hypothetical protein
MKKTLFVLGLLAITIGIFILIVYLFNQDSGKGALQVTSNPKSKVYLDGKLIGETPLCKCDAKQTIPVGTHTIRLIPNTGNFLSFEDKITISSSVLTVVDRNFGEGAFSSGSIISLTPINDKKDAQLSVVTFPDKTLLTLDNTQSPSGVSPLLLKNLTESDHELKIAKEGYLDKVLRIRAVNGYRLEAIITLSVLPDTSSGSAFLEASQTPTPTVVASPSAQITVLSTPTGFLRVREDASISSVEIGRVNPGEKYEFVEEKTGWYKIKLTDGKVGWVSSQYSTKQ